jgi:uncharacterized protein (UPF0335 family)
LGPIDPRLRIEIDTAKAQGLDLKRTKFGVIIQHKEAIGKLGESTERENAIKELESLAAEKLSSIISKLEELGAQKLKVLPLANSVFAELTANQIMEISKLEDVKIIRLSAEEEVTC